MWFDLHKLINDSDYRQRNVPIIWDQLKEQSYFVLEVDEEYEKILQETNETALEFFESNSDAEKRLLTFSTEEVGFRYFGNKKSSQGFTVNLPRDGYPFPWPDHPSSFEPVVRAYFNKQQDLGTTILDLVGDTIFGDKEHFSKVIPNPDCDYTDSVLFIRYYQPIPKTNKEEIESLKNPKDYTHEHTDSGILTIKPMSDISGLQVPMTVLRIPREENTPHGGLSTPSILMCVGHV
eukprot:TRINITY_DN999_c0_g1_i1.p2 TRINITY_DN999_c0_g1~~TRINITY_DN999_c0_g1_i1.p2  ORF type:complete len:235 (-),score=31.47 TRINITY_DN999_c0_g1_i1:419-1123(-)